MESLKTRKKSTVTFIKTNNYLGIKEEKIIFLHFDMITPNL